MDPWGSVGTVLRSYIKCASAKFAWKGICSPNSKDTCIIISTFRTAQCTEGDIRVMDGTTRYEGRVEVCVGEVWGTVCDNGFHSVDAGVACHQLGFSRIGENCSI